MFEPGANWLATIHNGLVTAPSLAPPPGAEAYLAAIERVGRLDSTLTTASFEGGLTTAPAGNIREVIVTGGDETGPVAYPVACLPQAWASGAVFMLLQSALAIQINGGGKRQRPRGYRVSRRYADQRITEWDNLRPGRAGSHPIDVDPNNRERECPEHVDWPDTVPCWLASAAFKPTSRSACWSRARYPSPSAVR
jgi:hypothetical protein